MKKSLLAMAALTAFAGVASAQSSVTLFGVVDVAARSVKNGSAGSIKSLSNDGNSSSRFGVRGVEDLGGGMKASFWLEATLSADAGGSGAPGGAFWNRRSTVSLQGNFGEVRLGRDYTPTFWNHTVFDPFGTNGVGNSNNLVGQATATSASNTTAPLALQTLPLPSGGAAGVGPAGDARTGTFVRADNSIGYFLPALGGLYGQAMVAAGENRAGAKYVGGRIGYAAGPVNVAAAYGKTDLIRQDLVHWNVGGSFNAGFLTVTGNYAKFKIDSGEIAPFGGRDQTNWFIGGLVPIGAGTIKFSYGEVDGHIISTATKQKAKQYAGGYVYDLSKRTAIFAHVAQVKNDAGLRFVASGSGPVPGAATGFKSTGYEFGVRHNF